jgi:hypothetical protein
MSLSPILDVLIGMAGVYIAFSLLASWCQERAAAWLELRSKGLVTALYQILNGDKTAFTQFTQDPIFVALQQAGKNTIQSTPPAAPAAVDAAAPPAVADPATVAGPSYMSKEQFSTIFMNLLAANGAKVAAAASVATTVDPATGVTQAQAAAAAAADVRKSIQDAGNALGVGSQVSAVLAKSGADINGFVAGVETLFDDHMDRVSGWYKRESHKILVIIGAVLVVFFNLDSVRLYEGLNCNSALRGAVAAATNAAGGTDPSHSPLVQGMVQAIPLGWSLQSDTYLFDSPIACFNGDAKTTQNPPAKAPPSFWGWVVYLLLKVLGLAITVIALSLGAPFWFDTLSALTNVRAAGKKPDSNGAATK